uniref:Uncharacterized protein n=1 Tax=Panagrolaimus superbus TaxID=310955 RepID=A0A914ZEN4_9BILA
MNLNITINFEIKNETGFPPVGNGHNAYFGHNEVGHNEVGHNAYFGHNEVGHNEVGQNEVFFKKIRFLNI